MLQAKETGIGSDRLGLCLVCAFSLPPVKKEVGGIIIPKFWDEISLTNENLFQWRPVGRGGGRGGPPPPPPPYFQTKLTPEGPKEFFLRSAPFPLSEGLDLPYLPKFRLILILFLQFLDD